MQKPTINKNFFIQLSNYMLSISSIFKKIIIVEKENKMCTFKYMIRVLKKAKKEAKND